MAKKPMLLYMENHLYTCLRYHYFSSIFILKLLLASCKSSKSQSSRDSEIERYLVRFFGIIMICEQLFQDFNS